MVNQTERELHEASETIADLTVMATDYKELARRLAEALERGRAFAFLHRGSYHAGLARHRTGTCACLAKNCLHRQAWTFYQDSAGVAADARKAGLVS